MSTSYCECGKEHVATYSINTTLYASHCMSPPCLKLMLEACPCAVGQCLEQSVHLDPDAGCRDAGVPTHNELMNGIVNKDVLVLQREKGLQQVNEALTPSSTDIVGSCNTADTSSKVQHQEMSCNGTEYT